MTVKIGNAHLLTVSGLKLFVWVVISRVATAEHPDSTWGLRYQPWHGWCVNTQLKKTKS